MVSKILNPITGRMINSHSITAKMIIHNYQTGGLPGQFNRMISWAQRSRVGRRISSGVEKAKQSKRGKAAREKIAAAKKKNEKLQKEFAIVKLLKKHQLN